jgi:hypothetical protein
VHCADGHSLRVSRASVAVVVVVISRPPVGNSGA